MWLEICSQNIALKALFEIIVFLPVSFYKVITLVLRLAQILFTGLYVKTFVTLRDYFCCLTCNLSLKTKLTMFVKDSRKPLRILLYLTIKFYI